MNFRLIMIVWPCDTEEYKGKYFGQVGYITEEEEEPLVYNNTPLFVMEPYDTRLQALEANLKYITKWEPWIRELEKNKKEN